MRAAASEFQKGMEMRMEDEKWAREKSERVRHVLLTSSSYSSGDARQADGLSCVYVALTMGAYCGFVEVIGA